MRRVHTHEGKYCESDMNFKVGGDEIAMDGILFSNNQKFKAYQNNLVCHGFLTFIVHPLNTSNDEFCRNKCLRCYKTFFLFDLRKRERGR